MRKKVSPEQERLGRFEKLLEEGGIQSVCAKRYPYLGGCRAVFYRNTDGNGGWLKYTKQTGANSASDIAMEISDAQVKAADDVDFDPYNDAKYAQQLLRMAEEITSA